MNGTSYTIEVDRSEAAALLLALDIGSDILITGDQGAQSDARGTEMLDLYTRLLNDLPVTVSVSYRYRHLYPRRPDPAPDAAERC